jgi:hypothetical protein
LDIGLTSSPFKNSTVLKLWQKPQKRKRILKFQTRELVGSSKEGRKLGEDQRCCGLKTGWRFIKEEAFCIDTLVI